MFFRDIPGHQKIKNELISLVKNNRVPHAIILTGPEGNGKLAFALALASYIQCKSRQEDDICGICPSCKKTQKNYHPDINFTFPIIASQKKKSDIEFHSDWRKNIAGNPFIELNDWISIMDGESKQANINRESVISISEFFNIGMFEGEKKIMIIWNAELLGNEGNRLLKLIEEPPANSLLIFVAENTSQILNTILSRCQVIRIPPFSNDDLEKFARIKYSENEKIMLQLINMADGNISKLMKLMDSDNSDLFELLIKWLNTSYLGKADGISSFAEEFTKLNKFSQKQFFIYTLKFLEQTLRSDFLKSSDLKLSEKEKSSMEKIKQMLNQDKILNLIEQVNQNIYYYDRNANPKILIFEASLRLNMLMKT
jgi:DNA polymerase-3 subunit delta'